MNRAGVTLASALSACLLTSFTLACGEESTAELAKRIIATPAGRSAAGRIALPEASRAFQRMEKISGLTIPTRCVGLERVREDACPLEPEFFDEPLQFLEFGVRFSGKSNNECRPESQVGDRLAKVRAGDGPRLRQRT